MSWVIAIAPNSIKWLLNLRCELVDSSFYYYYKRSFLIYMQEIEKVVVKKVQTSKAQQLMKQKIELTRRLETLSKFILSGSFVLIVVLTLFLLSGLPNALSTKYRDPYLYSLLMIVPHALLQFTTMMEVKAMVHLFMEMWIILLCMERSCDIIK